MVRRAELQGDLLHGSAYERHEVDLDTCTRVPCAAVLEVAIGHDGRTWRARVSRGEVRIDVTELWRDAGGTVRPRGLDGQGDTWAAAIDQLRAELGDDAGPGSVALRAAVLAVAPVSGHPVPR